MGSPEHYRRVLAVLAEARTRHRGRALVVGGVSALALTLGLLLALTLADWLFAPAAVGRSLLSIALLGGAALAVHSRVVTPALEQPRDDYFAALLEERAAGARDRLLAALQLGRGDQAGHSPELVARVVRDGAEAADAVDGRAILDPLPLRRAFGALAGVLLTGTITLIAGGPGLRVALSRVVLPWAEIAPHTLNRIAELSPGDVSVPEGDPLPVRVRVDGPTTDSATLTIVSVGEPDRVVPMQRDADGPNTFHALLASVGRSATLTVRAGDAPARSLALTVLLRPRVASVSVPTRLPAYAGGTESADGAAYPGGTAEVRVEATKPLKAATLRLRDGRDVPLAIEADPRRASGTLSLWAADASGTPPDAARRVDLPADYQIRLTDTDGVSNHRPARPELGAAAIEPLWRQLPRSRDAAPTLLLLQPDGAPALDRRVNAADEVSLLVEARDDFCLDGLRVLYRVGDGPVRNLSQSQFQARVGGEPFRVRLPVSLSAAGVGAKGGERVAVWAEATDYNDVTGPGKAESRRLILTVVATDRLPERLKVSLGNYIVLLEEVIRVQTQNRAQTALARPADGVADATPARLFDPLVKRQAEVRRMTDSLARMMEREALRVPTLITELDDLRSGKMAEAQALLEQARDAAAAQSVSFRDRALPVEDAILEALRAMLARLQRNEEARKALTRLAKEDKPTQQKLAAQLAELIGNLNRTIDEAATLGGKFEALPKKPVDEWKEEAAKLEKELAEFKRRTKDWTKCSVNEMTKLGTGFVDDFGLRKDVNRVYEEIEGKGRGKAEEIAVAVEDMGVGLATKMKEDLEMWLPDAPDSAKWVQEEPVQNKPLNVPEMPLPDRLQDLVGDLLQKADEFDEEADDITSAWADNLDQAGWGVSDGPISSFSAKGKTGNDQPNAHEVTGRSGDGRRGKSAGQMVGDTARALPGRKTPARLGNERYEPGQLKQEGQSDPNGATGGGKKAGAGRQGLQGGSPPDPVKDIGRLSAKQAGLRESMEQVARKLEEQSQSATRVREAMELMKQSETALRDGKYDDAARKRQEALGTLRRAGDAGESVRRSVSQNRDLPPELRREVLQGGEEGAAPGYEGMTRDYLKALGEPGK